MTNKRREFIENEHFTVLNDRALVFQEHATSSNEYRYIYDYSKPKDKKELNTLNKQFFHRLQDLKELGYDVSNWSNLIKSIKKKDSKLQFYKGEK